jgi:sialate O-acetylesterase
MIFGLIDSSWGGTAIEPWMDTASLRACGEGSHVASASNSYLDPGLPQARAQKGVSGLPTLPSTLYNAMIAPLRHTSLSAVLWYQGESNAGNPTGYARCVGNV